MGKPRKRIKPRPSRDRSCLGKQAFESYEKAEIASRRPNDWIKRHGFMAPYKCHYCGMYHYGHPIRRA